MKNIDEDANNEEEDYCTSSSSDDDEGDEQGGVFTKEEEEQEELQLISHAIAMALGEDAGGFGTAGFHVVRICSYFILWL